MILKASRQKHRSWQLYSNEKNGLQQFQMERLKDKKKKKSEMCGEEWGRKNVKDRRIWHVVLQSL
jgi:hypothetical protein